MALDLPGLPPCVALSRSGESGDGLLTASSPELEHRWIGAEVIAEHMTRATSAGPSCPGPWAPEVGVGITDVSLGYGVEIRPGPSM